MNYPTRIDIHIHADDVMESLQVRPDLVAVDIKSNVSLYLRSREDCARLSGILDVAFAPTVEDYRAWRRMG